MLCLTLRIVNFGFILVKVIVLNAMEEANKRDCNQMSYLEDTVRNLREENAKLLQLLQGLPLDSPLNGKSSEPTSAPVPETTNITFDHSDLTLTTNSVTTTNQINQQHIHNHGPMNQQNHNEQTIHGSQSNITPNFNTVIQTNSQPFVQNNSNTLVQNNTNLIQPINLVNFNNVSLDSIQSFFASQNNVMYLSQTSTSASTIPTNTTTMTSTSSILTNCPPNESSISIRSRSCVNRLNQELVPVIPKIKAEYYEKLTRQYANSSNNEPKKRIQRSMRSRPSSRIHISSTANKSKSSSDTLCSSSSTRDDNSLSIRLFSSPDYQSQSSSIENQNDLPIHIPNPQSLDHSRSPVRKKSTKPRQRSNRKKLLTSSIISITANPARPSLIIKRSTTNRKPTKRHIKTLVQSQSENLTSTICSSPSNAFARSISGLLENLDQELMASNFLSQAVANNLLSDDTTTPVQQVVSAAIECSEETYHTTTASMPTLEEFHDRLENGTHDFNVENEQITAFMSEEDMRLVEMNFDETTFLKQFDLDDAGLRLSGNSDQNIFACISTDNQTNSSTSHPSSALYSSSSLISNSVFTTVVPLGSQLPTNTLLNQEKETNSDMTCLLPEEGIQLTARHIEPSQVATYESVNYQDILDDLVMVTDQDVLRHAQAATTDNSSIASSEFTFTLLETTNDIINSTHIQLTTEQASTVLNELQYLYPIDQQRQHDAVEKQTEIQPIAIPETLQCDIVASTTLDSSNLSPLLPMISMHSSDRSMALTEIITGVCSDRQPSNDLDSLLPSLDVPNAFANLPAKNTSDTSVLSSNSPRSESASQICILSGSSAALSNIAQNEMIIDSGRVEQLTTDTDTLCNDVGVIEDLLRETATASPFEIIENQGKTLMKQHVVIDNVDRLLEQVEPKRIDSQLFERTFSRYQQKYHSSLLHRHTVQIKRCEELPPSTPPVTLKLEEVQKSKPLEQTSIILTLHANLSQNVSSEERTHNRQIQKHKKKRGHRKKKIIPNPPQEIEIASLTRFEQSPAEFYEQPSPPISDEAQLKNETQPLSPSPPPTATTTTLHSGFIIEEQTPPSSITSFEHKQSPPPLLYNNPDTSDRLTTNDSHLHDYHEHHQTNNAFITPPPEMDLHSHRASSYESVHRFSNSPNKRNHHRRHSRRHHHRNSSTSSKSLTSTDYALDTYALEPVSPTPIETQKQKQSCSTTTNYNVILPSRADHRHQQQKQSQDYHSKKSSSTRSPRPISSSSQMHQQTRSLSNHNYRVPEEQSSLPPTLPPSHPSIYFNSYVQSFHHYAPRAFYNFSLPHSYLDPHSTSHVSDHHHRSYSRHSSQYSHSKRRQYYNNSNHSSSRDHRAFNR
ncbi:unnamed protein product [Adineta ricciae]|uniref:Uncharacterized protein n=1 Tax=Adineta ricciae TaxID=249248 RepID=A0A815AWJ1_ADIRI|nr:unnamed protein product [Adineta ricciae]CAF1442394.1 unnamed protein product [Adineta ricciae]